MDHTTNAGSRVVLTEKERASLAAFFERHPHPPYLDGPQVARYYRDES